MENWWPLISCTADVYANCYVSVGHILIHAILLLLILGFRLQCKSSTSANFKCTTRLNSQLFGVKAKEIRINHPRVVFFSSGGKVLQKTSVMFSCLKIEQNFANEMELNERFRVGRLSFWCDCMCNCNCSVCVQPFRWQFIGQSDRSWHFSDCKPFITQKVRTTPTTMTTMIITTTKNNFNLCAKTLWCRVHKNCCVWIPQKIK